MDDILFEVVHEFKEEMFTTDMALYVEMMGDNYHTEEIVGVAWGTEKKIYVTNDLSVFENQAFHSWITDPTRLKKVYDAKRTYVALNRYTAIPSISVLFSFVSRRYAPSKTSKSIPFVFPV